MDGGTVLAYMARELSPAGILRTTLAPQLGQNFIGARAGKLKYTHYDTSRRRQTAFAPCKNSSNPDFRRNYARGPGLGAPPNGASRDNADTLAAGRLGIVLEGYITEKVCGFFEGH